MNKFAQIAIASLLAIPLGPAVVAAAPRIGSVTRLDGQREEKLTGMGLVVGLNGTGDGGDYMPAIRPLAQMLSAFKNGASIAELSDAKDVLDAKQAEAEVLALTISRAQDDTVARTAEYEAARSDAEAKLGDLIEGEERRRSAAAYAQLQASTTEASSSASTGSGDDGSAGTGSNRTSAEPAPDASNAENDGSANDPQDRDEGGSGESGTSPTANSDAGPSGGSDEGSDNDKQADSPPAEPPPAEPPVSGLAGVAIQAALDQLGVPYKYATSLPGVSFDCSGLTHYAWGQAGVYLPRNSRAQQASVRNVPIASAEPGDLLFYYSPISHVGIYLGGGQLVHAPNSGTTVKIANVSWDKVTAVARPG